MMSPGYTEYPDHRIETKFLNKRVEIFMEGEKIAESRRALVLFEPDQPPRYYIPLEDITGVELLKHKDDYCPYKGYSVLFNVKHGSRVFENAAWSFVQPFDDVAEIRNLVAFYPEKVQLIRVTG